MALLFLGIFLTMMPALGYLEQHGREFGFTRPAQYYFASGSLSSVLDNAPTYLNFLQLAEATFVDKAALPPAGGREVEADAGVKQMIASEHARRFIIAISLGSVFFGAMTYIGNGPNFMVKSIAESAGVKVPTFFGYLFQIQPAVSAADPRGGGIPDAVVRQRAGNQSPIEPCNGFIRSVVASVSPSTGSGQAPRQARNRRVEILSARSRSQLRSRFRPQFNLIRSS